MTAAPEAVEQRLPGGESWFSFLLRIIMIAVAAVCFTLVILIVVLTLFKKKIVEIGYKKAPKLMAKLGVKAPTVMSYMRGSINVTDVGMKYAPGAMGKINEKAPKLAAKMPAAKKGNGTPATPVEEAQMADVEDPPAVS